MKIPYMPVPTKQPIPSLGGSLLRHRPVTAVRLTGPADTRLYDGLLDTGSDDTVFEEGVKKPWPCARRLPAGGNPLPGSPSSR